VTRTDAIDWLRSRGPTVLLEVVVNVAGPFLIYTATHARWGDVAALLAASVPPLIWSLAGFVRNRRLDALSILVMAGIALSLLAFLGGGSARMLQLREKLVTLLIGLAFLGSAAIGKPLIWPLARATVGRQSPDALAQFDARRNDTGLRRAVMVMTLVWGTGLVAEFAVAVALIYLLPIADYLIVAPLVGYGTIGGLALWTALYRQRLRAKRGTAQR